MKKNEKEVLSFQIDLAPITKKNHQRIVVNPKTRVPFIIPSAEYTKYERQCALLLPVVDQPIDFPVHVKCLFYKKDKRKGDLSNYLEAIDDIMVKYGILQDDNYQIIVSHDGSRVRVDPKQPRTEIVITRAEPEDL